MILRTRWRPAWPASIRSSRYTVRMKSWPHLVTAASLVGAAIVAAIIVARPAAPRVPAVATPARPLPPGGDFVLRAADGPLATTDLRGRAVVLAFGYTACPDVCPTTLTTIAAALRELGDPAAVVPVFVSVDPERDTPAHLAAYVRYFHPALRGVTGTADEVAAVAARYQVEYARVSAQEGQGYSIDHSAEIYVLDRAGRPAARLAYDVPVAEVVAALRSVLAQPAPATAPPVASPPTSVAAPSPVAPVPPAAPAVMAHGAYVREVPPGATVTAAFLMLHNPGPTARALVAASSPAARTVQLHQHIDDHGVMRMRQVERIDVPAGGMVELAPGGYHIMMIDLVRPLARGETVALALQFDDGTVVNVDAPVQAAPAGAAHAHHGM